MIIARAMCTDFASAADVPPHDTAWQMANWTEKEITPC
jgi:hypothetical protein